MSYKKILEVVPTVQSAALLGENVKMFQKKDKKAKDFVGMATKNIVGTSLIGDTADIIGGIK